jgi:hypothetical protein
VCGRPRAGPQGACLGFTGLHWGSIVAEGSNAHFVAFRAALTATPADY